MNPVRIDSNEDSQFQSRTAVVMTEEEIGYRQSSEQGQLQQVSSQGQLETLNRFVLHVNKLQYACCLCISLAFAAIILLTIVVLSTIQSITAQCKVTDLIDNKVSIQHCEGKMFKFRIQNYTRREQHNYDDYYDFKDSIDSMVKQSPIYSMDQFEENATEIKKLQCLRAISLMEVVHNVNFKGEFVFDHYNFYPSPQAKAQALFKLLQQEKQYFDQKYQITKYAHDQIGICVYIPSYNNAKKRLYLRNLDSVFQQEYQNYHVVYVNDASTDGTGDYVKAYMEENEIPVQKYAIINNEKNKGNSENVFNAGHNYCNLGQIMLFLDGDDALIGRQVFSLLNAVYQEQKIALTYGQFVILNKNQFFIGYSRSIPNKLLEDGKLRMKRHFYSSHLKTMYVDLFREIKQGDLQYDDDGTFLKTASDVAYMTSAIQLAGTRIKFLNEINYEYHFDTGLNDIHFKQRIDSDVIYQKEPQKRLQTMGFADQPKTIHYN